MANGRIVAFVAIGADFVVGYLALSRWVWNSAWPEGLIQANGRIEDDHVTIASKFSRPHSGIACAGKSTSQGSYGMVLDVETFPVRYWIETRAP